MEHQLRQLIPREQGQGLSEYGLILALVSLAAIAVLRLIGPQAISLVQTGIDALSDAETP